MILVIGCEKELQKEKLLLLENGNLIWESNYLTFFPSSGYEFTMNLYMFDKYRNLLYEEEADFSEYIKPKENRFEDKDRGVKK